MHFLRLEMYVVYIDSSYTEIIRVTSVLISFDASPEFHELLATQIYLYYGMLG